MMEIERALPCILWSMEDLELWNCFFLAAFWEAITYSKTTRAELQRSSLRISKRAFPVALKRSRCNQNKFKSPASPLSSWCS